VTNPTKGKKPTALAIIKTVFMYSFLVFGVVYAVGPLMWGISTSLKTRVEIYAFPPRWIPHHPTFGNYIEVLARSRYPIYLRNTALVGVAAAALSLLLASHAAYAVNRFRPKGAGVFLSLMWMTVMIPGVSTIVPLYVLAVRTGLYNTLLALILVHSAYQVPTLVWLLRGFVGSVPREVEEAAYLDGCGILSAFYRITLRLLAPGLAAGAILTLVSVWNDFLWAYTLSLDDAARLVQVGVYFFVTEAGIQWGPLMAAAMGALIPVVVAFALVQRAFVEGLTSGAVVG
jgi:ABC-type glycerol-3-phosphate transport system permease component